jgi:cyanophycin synthetase
MVLRDPTVDVAVLETARGGILREGLGFQDSEVGAVLNISADHLGLKGIETVEDLADVKSLVVETVRRGGTSVLNADDPLTRKMASRAGGQIAWFSMNGGGDMPDWLREHIDDGGLAVVREPGENGGHLVLHHAAQREVVTAAENIPATLHGLAEFNIANALAAAAIAYAHGVPLLTIRSGLGMFQSTYEQNPGRLNVHDEHGFRVIMDYAHNVAGLTALGRVVSGLRHRYRRTIGVFSVPGDRRDSDILELGRISAEIFDLLFFREDPSTRGRPRGEVMALLRQGALAAGKEDHSITLIAGEANALQAGLREARTGDLLVVTPSDIEGSWRLIQDFRPVPPDAAEAHATGSKEIV